MAKRIVRLTESDLTRLVRRIIKEQESDIANVLTQKEYSLITDESIKNRYNQSLRNLNWSKKDYYKNEETGTTLATDGQQIYFIVAPRNVRELGPFNFNDIQNNL